MKKALALILTAAMLFSCLAVGASAARVVTEVEAQYDNAWLASGENFNANTDGFTSGDFTYEIKVYSDPDSNNGGLGEYNPTMGFGPEISMKNGKVGYGDVWIKGKHFLIDYTFAANTMYTVKYVVTGNDTVIYINDEYVGEINDAEYPMNDAVGNTNYGTLVSEIKITDADGDVRYHETFDSVPSDATGGSIEKIEVVPGSFKNENVAVSKDYAWLASGENFNANTDGFTSGDFTYELKVYSDPDSNAGNLGEYNPTMGFGPEISMKNGKVGYGDVWIKGKHFLIDYTFAANTWYDVKYVVTGNDTAIYINEEYVGSIEGAEYPMNDAVGNTNYGTYVSEVKITDADGNVRYHETFDSMPADATGGSIETFEVEGARYDLGAYYYGMDASVGHYFDPDYNVNGDDNVSFDFMFDSLTATDGDVGGGNRTDVFITGPKLSLADDVIGVNGATVSYDFKADVWYHAEFIADGSSTAIYVDGVYVGTVAAVMGDLCFNGHGLAVDNINFGGHFEDFEDQNFNESGSSHSDVYNYVFDIGPVADPYESLGMDKVAEGDAILIEDKFDGYGCGYANNYDNIGVKVNGAVAYVFDIALVDGNPYTNDKDPDGSKTFFEIWRDTASRRFTIGIDTENTQATGYAGDNDSVVGFDWGEFTATNFHNVVMVFKNRVGMIYVDGVKLYEGPSGQAGIGGNNTTLFSIFGGSAIIDNFAIYDVENEPVLQTEAFMGNKVENNGSWEGLRGWTVGGDCNTNGHVYSHTSVTVQETCYSVGEDTDYCTICGAGYQTHERAMVAHKFQKYDINRTADGLIYSACQNSGCVEKRFSTMTEEAYTGTINVYYDMADDFAGALYSDADTPNWFDNFKFENGVARTCEETYIQNYSRLNLEYYNSKPTSGDWSVNFDMTLNGTWDTEDVINSGYEHFTMWMLGGNNAMWLHFNVETDKIYVTSNPYSGTSLPAAEVDFDFEEGVTYNVKFSFKQYDMVIDEWYEDDELVQITEPAVDFYVYINGEVVFEYDYYNYEADIIGLAYSNPNASFEGFYNQSFGVDYSVDNFVIGSSDFDWTERCYEGDVNGDNYFNAADALTMRKFLAKVIDISELAAGRMDVNGDGAVNAKDQLAIRKALAA